MRTIIIACLFFIVGCGPPTVDISSDEAYEHSLETIKESLNAIDRQHFEKAVKHLTVIDEDSDFWASIMALKGENGPAFIDTLMGWGRKKIEGETGAEVILQWGDALRAERSDLTRKKVNAEKEFSDKDAKRLEEVVNDMESIKRSPPTR